MEQGIAAHADADGPAARDAEMIEQGQGVERALAMSQRFCWIGGLAMTAGVRRDQLVLAQQLIASGISPIAMTSGAAMQQQERRAGAIDRVMQVDAVQLHGGFGMLVGHRGPSLNSGVMLSERSPGLANASGSTPVAQLMFRVAIGVLRLPAAKRRLRSG